MLVVGGKLLVQGGVGVRVSPAVRVLLAMGDGG